MASDLSILHKNLIRKRGYFSPTYTVTDRNKSLYFSPNRIITPQIINNDSRQSDLRLQIITFGLKIILKLKPMAAIYD